MIAGDGDGLGRHAIPAMSYADALDDPEPPP